MTTVDNANSVKRGERVLIYGDVNLNILDGSAIWVQSMAEAMSRAGCDVTVVLKAKVRTGRLSDPIAAMPGVTVVRSFEDGHVRGNGDSMTAAEASDLLAKLDTDKPFDVVVLRGLRAVSAIVDSGHFDGRIWTYLTDVPQSATAMTQQVVTRLESIAEASRWMLCQTEELRAFLESSVGAACGKCVIWTPVVPPLEFTLPAREPLPVTEAETGRPIRLVYTGKFAPLWNTYEMTRIPALLAARGLAAEMHMIGDKIHEVPGDPGYSGKMRGALTGTPSVVWHGGMPRQDAMELSASMDLGMCWRDARMDASLELSTKLLEFGALNVPAVLNRTAMHEDLLGEDYPFFVETEQDIADAVAAAVADPSSYELAAARCAAASALFSMDVAIGRATRYLAAGAPLGADVVPELGNRAAKLKVVVASHDLKFFTRILEHYQALPEVEVRVDHWSALSVNDPAVSEEMLAWADVIVAEWCGPVAVWYSKRKRPEQRLIVRLHRFELDGPWMKDVEIDKIDQVVCVSPFYAQETARRTGWSDDRIVVVPNWVDVEQLDRPKLPGAEFNLGMIGIAPMRKRLDLGLDVLERVRRHDDRFTLFSKSKMPWDYWWIWRKPEEQEHYDEVFRRIQLSPHLRGAVVFDDFGADVATWLRRIGWVLSTSDDESFHLAPAEGMASSAIPALLPWPGSETIYDTRWIDADVDAMADRILETVSRGEWSTVGAEASLDVRAAFPMSDVVRTWTRLLVEDMPSHPNTVSLARSNS